MLEVVPTSRADIAAASSSHIANGPASSQTPRASRVLDIETVQRTAIEPTVEAVRALLNCAEIPKNDAMRNARNAVSALLDRSDHFAELCDRDLRAAALNGILEGFQQPTTPGKKTGYTPGYAGVREFLLGKKIFEHLEAVALGDTPLASYTDHRAPRHLKEACGWLRMYSTNLAMRYDYGVVTSSRDRTALSPGAGVFALQDSPPEMDPSTSRRKRRDHENGHAESLPIIPKAPEDPVLAPSLEERSVEKPKTADAPPATPAKEPETDQELEPVKPKVVLPPAVTHISSTRTLRTALSTMSKLVQYVEEPEREVAKRTHDALKSISVELRSLESLSRTLSRWMAQLAKGEHDDFVEHAARDIAAIFVEGDQSNLDRDDAPTLANALANELVTFGKKPGALARLKAWAKSEEPREQTRASNRVNELGEEIESRTTALTDGITALRRIASGNEQGSAQSVLYETAQAASQYITSAKGRLIQAAFRHQAAATRRVSSRFLEALVQEACIPDPITAVPESITDVPHSHALNHASQRILQLGKTVGGATTKAAASLHKLIDEISHGFDSLNTSVQALLRSHKEFWNGEERLHHGIQVAFSEVCTAIRNGRIVIEENDAAIEELSTRISTATLQHGNLQGLSLRLETVAHEGAGPLDTSAAAQVTSLGEALREKIGILLELSGSLRHPEGEERKQVAFARLKETVKASRDYCATRVNSLLGCAIRSQDQTIVAFKAQLTPAIRAAILAKREDEATEAKVVQETDPVDLPQDLEPEPSPAVRTRRKQTAARTREEVYDLLMNARQLDWVTLDLEDGSSLSGVVIFNQFRGTGRLINSDEEISFDFHVDQVVDVKF